MESLWQSGLQMGRFSTLEKDVNTDVLIIGGGMAGVLCAYMLHRAGVDYMLVEADRIGGGITASESHSPRLLIPPAGTLQSINAGAMTKTIWRRRRLISLGQC